jgi:hypothetical protein
VTGVDVATMGYGVTGVSVGAAVVGGTGVLEGVSVLVGGGRGVKVLVGGIRVDVGGGFSVKVGRARRVNVSVMVTKLGGVDVDVSEAGTSGVRLAVLVGDRVAVGTNTVTACSVRAAAVSRLETAKSRMLIG